MTNCGWFPGEGDHNQLEEREEPSHHSSHLFSVRYENLWRLGLDPQEDGKDWPEKPTSRSDPPAGEQEPLRERLSNMQAVRDSMDLTRWTAFENQQAGKLEAELARAEELGVRPLHGDDAGFDEVANQPNSRLNWVVTPSGDLLFSPKIVLGEEIAHTVLTRGGPVVAAGDAVIVADLDGPVCIDIMNGSDHYQPDEQSLLIGKKAFEAFGMAFFPIKRRSW